MQGGDVEEYKANRPPGPRYPQTGVVSKHGVDPRPASPRMVSREMVASMKPGSVIVDLAAERGGMAN